MKKYIVTLAAMALAIGGTVNLTGCSGCGGIDEDPDAAKNEAEQESVGTEMDEKMKAEAKKQGFKAGPDAGGGAPEKK